MKKLSIAIIVLLLLLFSMSAFAQESAGPPTTVTPTLQASPSGQAPAPFAYELPYPGILPDHPLWPIKALRDRIMGFLIGDPVKKAQFNLIQADKRLSAGISLFKKGKRQMAASTISKGENYFAQAVAQAYEAKRMGKGDSSLVEQLFKASHKHQAVLTELINQSADTSAPLQSELKRVGDQEKLVKDLRQ